MMRYVVCSFQQGSKPYTYRADDDILLGGFAIAPVGKDGFGLVRVIGVAQGDLPGIVIKRLAASVPLLKVLGKKYTATAPGTFLEYAARLSDGSPAVFDCEPLNVGDLALILNPSNIFSVSAISAVPAGVTLTRKNLSRILMRIDIPSDYTRE